MKSAGTHGVRAIMQQRGAQLGGGCYFIMLMLDPAAVVVERRASLGHAFTSAPQSDKHADYFVYTPSSNGRDNNTATSKIRPLYRLQHKQLNINSLLSG